MNTLRQINIENIDTTFTDLELVKTGFEGKVFEHCTFKNCNFSQSQFKNCKFVDSAFEKCNLNEIKVDYSLFNEIIFDQSNIQGINWTSAKWPNIKLTCPLKFYNCNISYSSFFALSLIDIVIEACKAHEVDFREADLSFATLVNTDFTGALFQHTNLKQANFSEAVNYFIDINQNKLSKAKFSFPEVINLLKPLDIEIVGFDEID